MASAPRWSPPPILLLVAVAALLLAGGAPPAAASDTSHNDKDAPSSPSCHNVFQLVKVKSWVNGSKGKTLGGLSARFGVLLPSDAEKGVKLPLVLSNPANCCSNSTAEIKGSLALSTRGDCDFITKAEIAQVEGAAGLLIINDDEELFEMVCPENGTAINISIPVIMVSNPLEVV
ncbi:hypothetical protein BT93_H1961 [Corymbia citriodora subsp. variegata]|nr:hypothetical protein BT93_H1961 [Corymbia citriodora subsp. variegata]